MPQSAPALMHVRGMHVPLPLPPPPPLPHWKCTPPPPHVSPDPQLPQSIVPLQPSLIIPHCAPADAHVCKPQPDPVFASAPPDGASDVPVPPSSPVFPLLCPPQANIPATTSVNHRADLIFILSGQHLTRGKPRPALISSTRVANGYRLVVCRREIR